MKNVISIITAFTFLANSIAWAGPITSLQSPVPSRKSQGDIFIPEQYGRIEKSQVPPRLQAVTGPETASSYGAGRSQVILIKDAHCVYEAQKNISKILDILIGDYKIDLVCVEGAVDRVDTKELGSYKDTEAREKVAEKYLKNGLFTAGEALSIKNGANPGFAIYGVEDAKLYWKDFQAFRDTVGVSNVSERFLELIGDIISQLKKKLYPEELLEFDSQVIGYEKGEVSLTEWVKYLSNQKPVRPRLCRGAPNQKNLKLVMRSIKLEEKIDFKKVEDERAVLIRRLEKGLVKEDLKELVKNSLLFKLGKISTLDYYRYLEGIGNAQMGENLRKYVKLVKIQARIDEDELFRELALTEEGIYRNLIQDEITGKLHRLDKDLNILKNILQLKANRGEILYYKENRANFMLDRFLDFIKIQAPLNGVPLPKEFNTPSFLVEVKKTISPSEEFYELALRRDEALVDNLLKRMDNAKKDKAVLVCGGFHAEGISNLLRDKGINLVTISPAITKAQEDSQKIYLSRMMDKRIKPVDILSQLGLGNIPPVVPHDTALPKTIGDMLLAGPEIDIQKFCKRVGVSEEELPKLTIKDLDRGLLRGLEEEYVTTDDDVYAGFLELIFSECNKTGPKEQIDLTALRGKRENIQKIKSELIANFLMESLGGKGRLILFTLAKHSFGAGDISPERFTEELYSGGVEAVNRCLGIDIEEVVFSIIKTWQEAEKARGEGRTDNEAYRKMGEFLGIIDENIGYVWHEKAPQFFAHLEKLSRVIENVNNFPETMLRAYRERVYLSISDEIEPNILDNIDFILSAINEIPEEIRARYKPYLYIYLHKEMDSIGGSNVYHEKGRINLKMVDAIRNNQERRKVLATIVVHEFFHKLVMGINAEGTDLILPIRDWIDFLLLNGIGTVINEEGEVSIEEYLDLDRYGIKEVNRRLYRLTSGNIRYSHTPTRDVEGEYYKKEIADPQELLAHMIASEIFGRDNFVYYEESFRVFDRHMLASFSPGKSYRYDREGMKWKTIGSDRGNKGDSVYIGGEDGDVQGCLAARLKNEKTGGRRFSLGKSADRVNIPVSFKNVSFKILVDVGELGISEQDFLDILKRVLTREDLSSEDLAKLQGRELTFATVSGYKSLGGDCKQNGIVLIHKVWREIYSANREVGLSLLEMILSHEIIFHEINGSPGDFKSEMARVQQDARDFFSAYLYYTRGQKLGNDDLRKIDDILSNYLQVSAVALFGLGRRSINSGDVKIFRKIYVSRRSLWSKTGLRIFEGVEFIVGVFSGKAKAFLRSVRLSLAILFGNIVICGLVILIALSLFLHRPPDVIPPAETPIKQGEVFIPAQGVEKDITRKVMPGKSEEKKITLLELPKKSAYTCEFNPAPNELDGYMDEVVPIIKKHMNGWRYDRVWDVEEGKWVWGKDDKWDGYSPEVLKALLLSIFYAESSDSHFKKIVDKPVKGSEWRYVRLKDSNGKYVWVELNVSSANEIGIAQIVPQTMEEEFIGRLTEDIFRIGVNTRDGGENWTSTTTARIRVGLINDLVFGGKLPIEEWEKFVGDEYTHEENSEKFKKKLRGKIVVKFNGFIKKCKEGWRFNLSVGACYFTLNIIEGYFSDEHLEDPLYPFLTQALYYYAVGGARQIKKDNPGTWVSKVYRENGDIPTYVNNISESFRRFTGLPIYVLRPAWRFTDGIDQSYIIDDFLARAIRFIAWGVSDTGDIPSLKILRGHLKVQIQRGGKPKKEQVEPKVKGRAGTHKAIGPTWSDEDNAVFEEQCIKLLSGIKEAKEKVVMDKIRDASVLANRKTNASGEDAVKDDRIAIHIVPLSTLGIPRRPGATSASEMVYAVGRDGYYDENGNLIKDGRLHIYVTRRYWDEYLSIMVKAGPRPLQLAETLDHEWQENVLGRKHSQAARRAWLFSDETGMSPFYRFCIDQLYESDDIDYLESIMGAHPNDPDGILSSYVELAIYGIKLRRPDLGGFSHQITIINIVQSRPEFAGKALNILLDILQRPGLDRSTYRGAIFAIRYIMKNPDESILTVLKNILLRFELDYNLCNQVAGLIVLFARVKPEFAMEVLSTLEGILQEHLENTNARCASANAIAGIARDIRRIDKPKFIRRFASTLTILEGVLRQPGPGAMFYRMLGLTVQPGVNVRVYTAAAYAIGHIIPLMPVRIQKKYLSRLLNLFILHRIRFMDGGNAENSFSTFAEGILTTAEQINTPAGTTPKFTQIRDIRKVPRGEDMTGFLADYELARDIPDASGGALGRTLVYKHKQNGTYLALKVLKKGEDAGLLVYESEMLDYIQMNYSRLGLRGSYPRPVLIDNNRVIRVKGLPKEAIRALEGQRTKEGDVLIPDNRYGCYALMAYEVDSRDYFIYLNNKDIEKKRYREAVMTNIHDLFSLARAGIVQLALIELFHNVAQSGRRDMGIYLWMVDIIMNFRGRSGAGRLHSWESAVRYPNMRLSGLADFADTDLLDYMLEDNQLNEPVDGTPWTPFSGFTRSIHLLNIHRRFGNPEMISKMYLANFLGNYILSMALAIGSRMKICNELNRRNTKKLAGFMREIFNTAYSVFKGGAVPEELDSSIDWDMLARQMAYFMSGAYIEDCKPSIPYEERVRRLREKGIYSDKTDISFGPYRDESWSDDIGWMGFLGDGRTDNRPALGPVNGPMPLQELVRALYFYTAFMVTDTLQTKRVSTTTVSRTHKAPGSAGLDEETKDGSEREFVMKQILGNKRREVVIPKEIDAELSAKVPSDKPDLGKVKVVVVEDINRYGFARGADKDKAKDLIYAVGRYNEKDSFVGALGEEKGIVYIYVTQRYWDEALSQNLPHLAETIDHEWQEKVLGKSHRQAAERAWLFVKKGQDLSEYHIFIIQQILSEGFSGLLYLAGILAEERKPRPLYGRGKGNYEEKFRRYIEEKIKSANPSCAILGSGDSAFYECIEGSPIIMTRTGDENRIKIEKEPVGEDDFEYTVTFIDKNGNGVGDVCFLDSGRELVINGYVLYMKGDTIKITNIKDKNSYVVTETPVISEELFNEGVITPAIGYTGEVNPVRSRTRPDVHRDATSNGVKKEDLVRSAVDKIKGQSGRVGNFVDIKGVSRLIVVGDLHGNYKNLMDILSRDNIWDDLKAGEAHLVILGDAIHPGSGDLACDSAQEDSVRMLLLLMKLIADLPQGSVTYILGDHELSHLDERYGVKKGDVYQDKVFEEYIIRQYGEDFLNIIKNFLRTLPYAVRINGGIVLTHAGASENLISEEHLKMLDAVDVDILSPGLLRDIMSRVEEERKVKEREINWFLRTLNCSLLITGHTPPSYVSGDMYNFSVVKKWAIGCAYGKQLIVDSQTDSPGYIDMDMKRSDTRKGLVALVDRDGKPALKVLGIDIVEEVVDEILGIFNKYGLKIERKDVWEAVVRAKGEVSVPPLERLFELLKDIPQLDLRGLFALTKEISGPLNKIIPDFDKKRGGELVANILTEILGEVEVKGREIAEGEAIREKFFNTVKGLLVSYGVTEAELAGEIELVELGLFLLEYEPLLKITKVDKAYLDYLAIVCELAGVKPDTLKSIFGNAYLDYQNKETLDKLVEMGVDVDKLTREELELELKRKGLWSRFKRADEIYNMIENGFNGAEVCEGNTILSRAVKRLRLYKRINDEKRQGEINIEGDTGYDFVGLDKAVDFRDVIAEKPQELVGYLSGTSVAQEWSGYLIDKLGIDKTRESMISIPEELFIKKIEGNKITYSPGITAVLKEAKGLIVEIRTKDDAMKEEIERIINLFSEDIKGRIKVVKYSNEELEERLKEIKKEEGQNSVFVLSEEQENIGSALEDRIRSNDIKVLCTDSMAIHAVLLYGMLQTQVPEMFKDKKYSDEGIDVIWKLKLFGIKEDIINKILKGNKAFVVITTNMLLRQYQLYRVTIAIAA